MINGTISSLHNKDGEAAFPITVAKAIYMDDGGTTLEDEAQKIRNQFNSNENYISLNKSNIDNIFKNVEEEEGTIEAKIQTCINKGFTKLIFPTLKAIDNLTINSTNIYYKFSKGITIIGNGITITGNSNTIECSSITGDNVIINDGSLSPKPIKKYAFSIKGAFNKIHFERVEGFDSGLLFEDGFNGTENNFEGLIQKCNKAVNFLNTTGEARHEGNTFGLRIFQCLEGYNIDENCKYQNINKVVDNAEINGSFDIIDNAGSNVFNLYFFRVQNSKISKNIVMYNVNGTPFYQVGSDSNNTRIGVGNVELKGQTTFIDFGDGTKDYDYRVVTSTTETGEKCLSIKSANRADSINILESGLPSFPNRSEGEYGAGWGSLPLPSTLSPGAFFFAYNTTVGKARIYVRIASGWRYFEQTGTVV